MTASTAAQIGISTPWRPASATTAGALAALGWFAMGRRDRAADSDDYDDEHEADERPAAQQASAQASAPAPAPPPTPPAREHDPEPDSPPPTPA